MDFERVFDPSNGTDSSEASNIATECSQGTVSLGETQKCIVTTAYNNPSEDTIRPDNAFFSSGSHQSFPVYASSIEQSEQIASSSHQSRKDDATPLETQGRDVPNATLLKSTTPTIRSSNQQVISNIEDQFAAIASGLQRREEIFISIKSKKPATLSTQINLEYEVIGTLVKFPGRTGQEAWRFGSKVETFQASDD